jgi:hypothetical protein
LREKARGFRLMPRRLYDITANLRYIFLITVHLLGTVEVYY